MKHRMTRLILSGIFTALLCTVTVISNQPALASEELDLLDIIEAKIQTSPDDLDLRRQHAELLERLGREPEAIDVYRWIIANEPQKPESFNNLARLLAAQGDLDEAILVLEQGIATSEIYRTLHENLRIIYLEIARQAYATALNEPESEKQAAKSPDRQVGLQKLNLQITAAARQPQAPLATEAIPDTTEPPENPALLAEREVLVEADPDQTISVESIVLEPRATNTQPLNRKFNDDAYDVPAKAISGDIEATSERPSVSKLARLFNNE